MPQLDRRVVEKARKRLLRRPDVNLSGGSFADEGLLFWIGAAVTDFGIGPGRLTFEITETTAVSDLLRVQRGIWRLRQLGCGFAIDDFGTGFSSFGYLRALPVAPWFLFCGTGVAESEVRAFPGKAAQEVFGGTRYANRAA